MNVIHLVNNQQNKQTVLYEFRALFKFFYVVIEIVTDFFALAVAEQQRFFSYQK